jgi:hypothetical protein
MNLQMSRNYTSHIKTPTILTNCPIPECNRKYKTEKALQKHVEEKHPYCTVGGHRHQVVFSHQIKEKIYKLAAKYAELILTFKDLSDNDMMENSKQLLPQQNPDKISQEDLVRISNAHRRFANRICENQLLQKCDWEKVMTHFQLFIGLGTPYYDTNFCPSLPIDFLWHSLMQDKELYTELCNLYYTTGILTHCDKSRSEAEDQQRYEYFVQIFHDIYGISTYWPQNDAQEEDQSVELTVQHFNSLAEREAKRKEELEAKREQEIEELEEKRKQELEEAAKRKQELEEAAKRKQELEEAAKTRLKKDLANERILKLERIERNTKNSPKEFRDFCLKVEVDINIASYTTFLQIHQQTGYTGNQLSSHIAYTQRPPPTALHRRYNSGSSC